MNREHSHHGTPNTSANEVLLGPTNKYKHPKCRVIDFKYYTAFYMFNDTWIVVGPTTQLLHN